MRFYPILFILISGELFSQDVKSVSESDLTKGVQYAANNFVGLNKTKPLPYELQQTSEKIADLKEIFKSYKSYPTSIIDGWHEVVVTDNSKIFKSAKVYINNNRIYEFFIDNCIELAFIVEREPAQGMATITLKKVSGDPLRTIDIYFMDDMEKPTTFPSPTEPGYVCIWTSKKGSLGRDINFAGQRIENLSKIFSEEPKCFDAGTTTVILKAGSYRLEILRSGNNFDRVINVQSRICTYYKVD